MPNKDGTGPKGEGVGTGRRMGNCFDNVKTSKQNPADEQRKYGRGCRCGNGQGSGQGRRRSGNR